MQYPWYERVENEVLEQGEIFTGCPLIILPDDLPQEVTASTFKASIELVEAVVMTQSCDLEQNKAASIALCPLWKISVAGENNPKLLKREIQSNIANGRMPRYLLLEQCQLPEIESEICIVDLEQIFRLPISLVRKMAVQQQPRRRLCSPYKEHLSQALARFYMRVGLPQNIQLP